MAIAIVTREANLIQSLTRCHRSNRDCVVLKGHSVFKKLPFVVSSVLLSTSLAEGRHKLPKLTLDANQIAEHLSQIESAAP